ncbi:Fructose-bisphosphate aldolase class 1 [Rhodobacteraceae bacterium IMCC1933]|nr:Fructose-bisphosphate aldolase class 1 [Rhodobacteraceae bacterium IMCC1923]MDP4067657.1 Fructose-bisphosphate aldolase class 1 [Rhodobacteraceae bacterium IMCC1933]MDP4070857.1 Fructose-bisphosphate aldolase class 1 [Rhodobacteraceae bacterium IMCC1909]
MSYQDQRDLIHTGQGFIAALDQSGGSTPKALAAYGVDAAAFSSDAEMFDMIHAMRSRIVRAPDFTGAKVVGAILFEDTMDREFDGQSAPQYLWQQRGVVPFLKVDKGLQDTADNVQLLKPMPDLDALLQHAAALGVFGTKMRSVIHGANPAGISQVVAQQFEIGAEIIAQGLIPILEPEVSITISDKAEAENLLHNAILTHLDALPADQTVMLKLTLPETANLYSRLCQHPRVLSVVALSGGYSRAEANARLSQNSKMIASFSRALTEGLSAQQSDAEFNQTLGQTIDEIYRASIAG